MPTLTTPSTVTFSLQIDQILTLTTNFGAGRIVLLAQRGGDVVFDYTGDNLLNTPVFSSGSQGIVTITHLSGSLTYNINTSTFGLDRSQVAAVQALASGGGTVVLLGDSITDMCGGLRTSGIWTPKNANGYWTWTEIALGARFGTVVNAGVSGDNLNAMLARFTKDVTLYSPNLVVFFGGINDVPSATAGNKATVLAAMQATATSIINAILALGSNCVLCTLTPVTAGQSWTAAQYEVRSKYNTWLRGVAKTTRRILLADFDDVMTDSSTAGQPLGDFVTPTPLFNNGVHPAASGACVMGKCIAAAITSQFPPVTVMAPNMALPQLLGNPGFSGASGATGPTSWNFSTIADPMVFAYSYGTVAGGTRGGPLVVDVTGGIYYNFGFEQIVSSGFSVGNTVRAAVRYSLAFAAATKSQCGIKIEARDGGAAVISRTDINYPTNAFTTAGWNLSLDSTVPPPLSGVLLTPPLVVPAGTASLVITGLMNGNAVWRFDRPAIYIES